MGIENQAAIVIGTSIAGLLSARVLSDRFASVTVIDTCSRPLLEWAIRRRMSSRVQFVEQKSVDGAI